MKQMLRILILFLCLTAISFAQTGAGSIQPPASTTLHSAVTADGNGATLNTRIFGAVKLTITITGTATVSFTGRINSLQTFGLRKGVKESDTSSSRVTATTSSGDYVVYLAGDEEFRAPISGCSSCTVTVVARPIPSTGKAIDGGGGGGGGGGAVDSVFGRTGTIVAESNDYTWAQIDKTTSSIANITTRSASDLSSGTLPDARFPATLPAASGVNLTSLNASNLGSGTVPLARLSGITNTEMSASAGIVDTKLATISTAGKVSDSALSANIPPLNAANVFTAKQTVTFTNSTVNANTLRSLVTSPTYSGDMASGASFDRGALTVSPTFTGTISNGGDAGLTAIEALPTFNVSTSDTGESLELRTLYFAPSVSAIIGASDSVSLYGVYTNLISNLGTTGTTKNYGMFSSVIGGADINYAIDLTASGGSTNYAIFSHAGRNRFTEPLEVGSGPTTLNDSAGKVLSAALNTVGVAQGGTGLTSGTSGGVLAYSASGTLVSSGALTANLPVIGGGAGVAPTVGTRSGNTTQFVTTTGTLTSGDCVKIDASGNFIANGSACGGGGGLTIGTTAITSGAATRLLYETSGNVVGEISGATSDGTTLTVTSPKIITALNDTNGNELFKVTATTSAVNEFTVANAVTTAGPTLSATGGDTNIAINITPKGSANINLNIPSGSNGGLQLASQVGFVNYASNVMGLYAGVGITAAKIGFGATGMKFLDATQFIKWHVGSGDFTGAADLGIGYNAAGVAEINNGTGGTLRDITLRASTLSSATAPITFSNAAYQSCIGFTSTAGGVLTCTVSTAKVKKDFLVFGGGIEAIRQIQPQTFSYRPDTPYFDGNRIHLGLIAENLQSANPLLVSATGAGMLQPEPLALHAIEIAALKQLDARLISLEQENVILRSRVRQLETQRFPKTKGEL